MTCHLLNDFRRLVISGYLAVVFYYLVVMSIHYCKRLPFRPFRLSDLSWRVVVVLAVWASSSSLLRIIYGSPFSAATVSRLRKEICHSNNNSFAVPHIPAANQPPSLHPNPALPCMVVVLLDEHHCTDTPLILISLSVSRLLLPYNYYV